MAPPDQISVPELSRLIGTPSAPTLVDVCIDEDFNADARLIPTSIRCPTATLRRLSQALRPEGPCHLPERPQAQPGRCCHPSRSWHAS